MNKHTPGPWQVGPSVNEIINADHGRLRFEIVAGNILIGAMYENESDARLIAAAPELLEALNAMLTHMGMDEDEWNKVTFDQARAAIAKATGAQT